MKQNRKGPIRILQVVGGMNRGGVETWLMHVLRHIDRNRFRMNFLVHTSQPCPYDEEIRALGSDIFPCLSPSRPWQYAMNFKQILRDQVPYDVVHSHVHHFSGFVVYLARRAGIPVRITHSHSYTSLNDDRVKMLRKGYLQLMKLLIRREATNGLSCSHQAAESLYGSEWQKYKRWQVLYCGIDLDPFKKPVCHAEVRRELGIPLDAFVLGHVGSFREEKNHTFLIDIAADVAKHDPFMRLLLVGDGHLRPEIKNKAARVGLSDKVIFTGIRSDVSRIMMGAMDVLVMPSLHEGLPLVGIEAQAASLPCFFSDVITEELNVIKSLVTYVSLTKKSLDWANEILRQRDHVKIKTDLNSICNMQGTPFDIASSIDHLISIYGKYISHYL